MTTERAAIEPDDKDWTWVLDRPCPDCGYDPASVDRADLGAEIRADAEFWAATLADPRATSRPAPDVWSPAEYGCHVRDVHRVFVGRVAQLIAEDDPQFANWDQDETAVAERYDEQDPADVLPALVAAAGAIADQYDRVADDQWSRPGRRSNGSVFTVETLGKYHLHDLVHHRWDVRWLAVG